MNSSPLILRRYNPLTPAKSLGNVPIRWNLCLGRMLQMEQSRMRGRNTHDFDPAFSTHDRRLPTTSTSLEHNLSPMAAISCC